MGQILAWKRFYELVASPHSKIKWIYNAIVAQNVTFGKSLGKATFNNQAII